MQNKKCRQTSATPGMRIHWTRTFGLSYFVERNNNKSKERKISTMIEL
jgi:hypothetical protein